jgi:hypothetical protein
MPWVADPATYRTGLYQLRPALFGWQYRTRPYGQTWGPWAFLFGRRDTVRHRIRAMLGDGFVEVPDWGPGQP